MRQRSAEGGGAPLSTREKARLVGEVFSAIARSYDLMNDLISFGTHRIAKRRAVAESGAAPGERVLDLGGGTGDIALRFGEAVDGGGLVVLADTNREMMEIARGRFSRSGADAPLACVGADALALPFRADAFDRILVSFGLRNFADISTALSAIRSVLKPGGTIVILDFSTPRNGFVQALFRFYLDRIVPTVARIVTGEARSYRYLAASVRTHPGARRLCEMMGEAGFGACSYRTMMSGALALHRGRKE